MSSESQFDLVVKNARVVQPNQNSVEQVDLGIKDGRFALLAPEIPAESASDIYDANSGRVRLRYLRRQELACLPRGSRCSHARWHLLTPRRGRLLREPGGGHGWRHGKSKLYANRPVLPQQEWGHTENFSQRCSNSPMADSTSIIAITWPR